MMMTTMVNKEQKEKIKNHGSRNIEHILAKLGIEYSIRGDGLIQDLCPCRQHAGDRNNRTAFSWRKDIGRWVCWTHHCEESRGNDVFGLVSSVLGTEFPDTLEWIKESLGDLNVDVTNDIKATVRSAKDANIYIHDPIKEDNLEFLQSDPHYLLNRGFDIDILRRYRAGLWVKPGTFMHNRVVFPIRDHDAHLIGYTGRTILSEDYFDRRNLKYSKWVHGRHYHLKPNPGELFTGSLLFNLCNAKKYRKLILVEGPLDGMKLEEAGIHNWVATLGTAFCHPHRTLLVNNGVTDLYVAYDNDAPKGPKQIKGGDLGWERMERIVAGLFNLHRIILPVGKDCGDLPIDELQMIFKDMVC